MRGISLVTTVVSIVVLAGASVATSAEAVTPSTAPSFVALPNSVNATTDPSIGSYNSPEMSVEVALAPSNGAQLHSLLANLYDTNSASYERWLSQGQFAAQFGPSRAETVDVEKYLTSSGLTISQSSTPFLMRATGSSGAVMAAFRTNLRAYRNSKGVSYYSNASAAQLPTDIANGVLGVVGLTNTARAQDSVQHVSNPKRPPAQSSKPATPTPTCEVPYPTASQQFAHVDAGASIPAGYGAGPGCSGLTPSQLNSIYSAPRIGPRGKAAGVNLAVFELSAYQPSDIDTWARTFYGPTYNPPLTDITVDGGPLNPACPAGDTCPANFNGYSGDIEVDADIEAQLAVSPDGKNLLVYNAPNDFTGQTALDEWSRIASDDTADVVSSSWAECENDVAAGYVQAENVIFEQMALQGQSVFGAEGDTGAFECIRSDGTTISNVLDPPAQPWVTSVGGTSLESFNPGANPHPAYPTGVETVWNTDDLCNSAPTGPANDNQSLGGFFWCAQSGAGGGGNSQWWGRPAYQFGPGINNAFTTRANGTTQCALARTGTPCRETPDVSVNADEFTPYAEFCTGSASTPFSTCATFSANETPPGWFGIGGTSLASPVWSAIIADRDSFQRHRSGNVNPLLYLLYNLAPHLYFHDINSNHTPNTNGEFPTVRGYDLATGIGTPIMSSIITRTF